MENKQTVVRKTENEKRNELSLFLFGACDILRGPINQDEYKSYVIPILFFKRISDVYDEETQQALEESGGDKEYASFPEQHSFIIPRGCHWNDVRNASSDVGIAIAQAMNGIERANPDTLSGVFSSFDDANWTDKTKLTDERLKDLVEYLSGKSFGNKVYEADVMGDSYEYLLKRFADLSKKNAGEFYTPRNIVKLMIQLLDPRAGETVYDPACGTGGMLIESIHHMENSNISFGKIFGQEKNLSTASIARMNMFLHGARDFKIANGDTLRNPAFIQGDSLKTFDCVVANPPFSLKEWGSTQFESDRYGRNIWGCPSDKNGDYAWLQHMVKSMDKEDGRLAVVLSQGVLFRGNKEGEIREKLIASDKVEAVIGLPSGVFFSTGVSACILFLKNKKEDSHKGKILLIDATKEFVHERAQNILTEQNAQNILGLFNGYCDVINKSKVITIKDIIEKENGYSLDPKTYVERPETKPIDPAAVKAEFNAAVEEMSKAEAKMNALLKEGGYIDGK
jgi:type I restriction enzyme M protein